MKKITLSLIALVFATNFSYAQTNTFPTSGNAGLGTTTPPTYSSYGVLALNGSSPFQGGYLSLMTNGTEVGALVANSQLNISTASGLVTQFSTGGSPTMQISSSGNVGIGTTSPTSLMHINGVTTIRSNTSTDGYISINPGGSAYQGYINWWKPGGARVGYMGYTDGATANNLALTLEASANFVVNGGNVLINRTTQNNSAYKLDVDGYIHATKIVVNTSGADFVFAPSYKLNSLANVEKYIRANHHLPEIPSAREMEENGLSLGDNQVKLLQKVEELTLYLIQKDKENKTLQKEITTLKKQQQKQIDALSAKLDKVLKARPNQAK